MAYERREVVTSGAPDPYDLDRTEVIETAPETAAVASRRATTAAVDRTRTVSYDPYQERRWSATRLVQAVYLIFGLIETLILIRFVLRVLGANPDAGFAQFIYAVTGGLVAPFVGLFSTPSAGNGSVLELHSIVALVIYALVGWLVAKVVWLLFGDTRSAVSTTATSVDTHVH